MSFPWQGERQDYYIPMINFDTVESGLYRSGFPLARNMPFIRKLGIRTILFIEPDQSKKDYTKEMDERCKAEGIQFLYLPLEVNLFPNDPSRVNRSLEAILSILLDRRNYPILINCLKGQHYTGILVACIRRLQQWSMTSIMMEFSHFEKKIRVYDMVLVELFKIHLDVDPSFLPSWMSLDQYNEVKALMQS